MRGYKLLVLFFVLFSWPLLAEIREEKKFVFIIPSYNNSQFYRKNLSSVFMQNYKNYRVIYIDDCSPDGTADLVELYIKECGFEEKVILIANKRRQFTLANIYHAAHMCHDDEILVFLDGDDFIAHRSVLTMLNKIYNNPDTWLTYGNHIRSDGGPGSCLPINESIITQNSYRDYAWVATHLRTSYAWLFKIIYLEDLLFQGKFFPVACDLAFMYPMLEMSGGRFKFIQNILCIYNVDNALSHFNKNKKWQRLHAEIVYNKRRYTPLKNKFKIGEYIEQSYPLGMIIIADDASQKLELFLKRTKFLKNIRDIFVLIDSSDSRYKSLLAHFPEIKVIEQSFENGLFNLEELKNNLHLPVYLLCSCDCEDLFLTDLEKTTRILKQTRAFMFALHDQPKEKKLSKYAFIDENIHAYQLEFYPFEKDQIKKKWAYLITRKELMNNSSFLPQIIKNSLEVSEELMPRFGQKVILYQKNE